MLKTVLPLIRKNYILFLALFLFIALGVFLTFIFTEVFGFPIVYNCVPAGYYTPLFIFGLLLLIPVIFIVSLRSLESSLKYSIALGSWGAVCAGGLGNAFDVLVNGCVKDYINFFGLFHNNIFDFFVVIGLSVLGYLVISKDISK